MSTKLKVISVHHHEGDYMTLRKKLLMNLFRKRIMFAGVSDFITNDLKKSFENWNERKFVTIHNSYSILLKKKYLLPKNKARNFFNFQKNDFIFANVGRLHEEKNQQILIKSFSKFLVTNKSSNKNFKLILIGTGSEKENLISLAKKLKCFEKIIFYGYLHDAKKYFKAFDFFILPSINEPFGMVLLESIYASIITIASNSGGPKEIIKDKNFLFNHFDENDLYLKMSNLYNNLNKTKSKSLQIRNYSMNNFLTNNFKFFLKTNKKLKFFLNN